MILALRTDRPEASLSLLEGDKAIYEYTWQAHRELSDTIFEKIDSILATQNKKITDLKGIVIYQGPGSFTGLRIGITVANTLSYSLSIPIAAAVGESWLAEALKKLSTKTYDDTIITPEYGSAPHITQPRK